MLTLERNSTEAQASPVRVLVVDDSAYMRFTISKYLGEAAGIEVVGTAHDGHEALRLIPELQPTVVTLDIQMPRMDGLTALREIMARHPMPVVMLSSLTTEGAQETVQALTWGAVDFVTKPTAKANVAAIIDEVIAKVRGAACARVWPTKSTAALKAAARNNGGLESRLGVKTPRRMKSSDKVVVIGTSTGGPRALNAVVPNLPADLAAAVLIVQHMPVGFTKSLAERLNSVSLLAVKEAENGDHLEVGRGLLAPGGFHMMVDDNDLVSLNRNPTVHGVRPAVDVTMASVAQRYGASAIGVVLTGMGRDGTNGASLIHGSGGQVIAEDESTCVVWGMPRSVAEAGVTDAVVPLDGVAEAIVRAVNS
ncbi:MAG: chemotaxis response regulator protein-glutamate methylesterase [Chloroflexi bacterium]|nr:chemotaxis response regulator protein-glutamate methylesterase [Chloroflexota bacterium]